MHTREEKIEAFGRLLDVLDELRVKCPWDRKQTNESLRPNTIEEVYELCDALMKDDKKNICKELGDVLLHVVFYAKIGSETGDFDIKDVCDRLCDENWEQIKLKEKDGNKSVLSGVPEALPSLIKAYRIQDKARNVGFDWEDRTQVWDKVKEEISEFESEVATMDKEKAEAEFGDVMFSLINAARLYKINPDNALGRDGRYLGRGEKARALGGVVDLLFILHWQSQYYCILQGSYAGFEQVQLVALHADVCLTTMG